MTRAKHVTVQLVYILRCLIKSELTGKDSRSIVPADERFRMIYSEDHSAKFVLPRSQKRQVLNTNMIFIIFPTPSAGKENRACRRKNGGDERSGQGSCVVNRPPITTTKVISSCCQDCAVHTATEVSNNVI